MCSVTLEEIQGQLRTLQEGSELKALEAAIHNQEVHKSNRFNIFDALQVTRLEIPHSNFLAFLLRPSENHGLGDAFAKALLGKVVAPEFLTWDLAELEVHRELYRIDILLIDRVHNTVGAIENKIDSGEHGNQLQIYWDELGKRYEGMQRFALYLSPYGSQPTLSEYKAIDYNLIADLLDGLLQDPVRSIEPDVRSAIRQYVEMLRRHIVNDLEVTNRSLDIYRRVGVRLSMVMQPTPVAVAAV